MRNPSTPMRKVCDLHDGYELFVQDNGAGGRSYYSNEIDGGVLIYDTCLHDRAVIIMAMAEEVRLEYIEMIPNEDAQ